MSRVLSVLLAASVALPAAAADIPVFRYKMATIGDVPGGNPGGGGGPGGGETDPTDPSDPDEPGGPTDPEDPVDPKPPLPESDAPSFASVDVAAIKESWSSPDRMDWQGAILVDDGTSPNTVRIDPVAMGRWIAKQGLDDPSNPDYLASVSYGAGDGYVTVAWPACGNYRVGLSKTDDRNFAWRQTITPSASYGDNWCGTIPFHLKVVDADGRGETWGFDTGMREPLPEGTDIGTYLPDGTAWDVAVSGYRSDIWVLSKGTSLIIRKTIEARDDLTIRNADGSLSGTNHGGVDVRPHEDDELGGQFTFNGVRANGPNFRMRPMADADVPSGLLALAKRSGRHVYHVDPTISFNRVSVTSCEGMTDWNGNPTPRLSGTTEIHSSYRYEMVAVEEGGREHRIHRRLENPNDFTQVNCTE